jgi:Oxidoreductase family, NAD-binding Rossmann fold
MGHATAGQTIEGKRLRVGMVGGGRNTFIGAVHRMAMRLDDLFELKAGALSSDAENARASGAHLGLAPDRVYSDFRDMAARDGVEAVAIVTPNHLHIPSPRHSWKRASTSSATSRCPPRLPKRRNWSNSPARPVSCSRSRSTIPAIRWSGRRAR